jgi:hypothetical protein
MNQKSVKYYLNRDYRFVIENYNWAKPFSSFFPGIGGRWGIPLWVYYVNRAQCVSSMGVRDKDHAILEFYSFNKALQLIGQLGFRTFLKVRGTLYEPFRKNKDGRIKQKMVVSSEELEINDFNPRLGLETRVLYFPLVNEPVAALVREVKVRNLEIRPVRLEIVDGLPRVLPYGVNQSHVKFIARHIEGMMGVDEVEGIPIFRLKQTPADIPEVGKISGGNFYFGSLDGRKIPGKHLIVDPSVIFGEDGYEFPWAFEESSLRDLLVTEQIRENKTPCAFTTLIANLPARGEITLRSIVGNAPDEEKLRVFLGSLKRRGFFEHKREENREIIGRIKNYAFTASDSPEFDQYCQQTFLDNVLRGGMPLILGGAEKKHILYLYSRMHGDLERDYHYFVLEPTYLSQGTHFYRDVLQNRRNDVWFFPEIGDFNLVTFLSLLQTDGYNPQVIKALTWTVEDMVSFEKWLKKIVKNEKLFRELLEVISGPFTPGEFIMKLEAGGSWHPRELEKTCAELLQFCRQNDVGDLHEGFWVDHWTYNLDSIDSFLAVYPEKLREILLGRRGFTFYDNPDTVLPREEKYVLVDGKVRQYGSVIRNPEKAEMIKSRSEYPTRVRTECGRGPVYETNLLVKLLSLASNKLASLDPQGIGMMMEADKPGWCDSLNGLPGLFGSSLCETLELERLCRFLRKSLDEIGIKDEEPVSLYEELHDFIRGLDKAVERRLNSRKPEKTFIYWEECNRLKEHYREKTRMGLTGLEKKMTAAEIKNFLDKCLRLLTEVFGPENRRKIFHENGVCRTYFINEVVEYEPIWKNPRKKIPVLGHTGYPLVRAKKFRSRPMPLFLEGPVHLLRVHPELRDQIYRSVRKSQLYDRKLKMYRNCESLEEEPFEIGRILAYAPGWIERGIYLHMEYKWLLELLRSGLHREFYREIRTALVPFLDPEIYGRNILEGVSFIVSGAFPDEELHGRGFQPRLSGATSEMLHIWTLMVAGEKPFFLSEEGQLMLRLRPILPGWLFTKRRKTCCYYDGEGKAKTITIPENAFAFKFLGRSLVVYHNRKRKDTFGKDGARVVSYHLRYRDGKEETVLRNVLETDLAKAVREGRVERIDVVLS